jgi:hypothetical protein
MRLGAAFALSAGLLLASCGGGEPHDYPAEARANFDASCPPSEAECVCTWDRITRTMPYEEYQTALEAFRTNGLMDPRITRARTHCLERNPG